jgi:hypothetical protein
MKITRLETEIADARIEQQVAQKKADGLNRLIAELQLTRETAALAAAAPETTGQRETVEPAPEMIARPRRPMRFIVPLALFGLCSATLAYGAYHLGVPDILAAHFPGLRHVAGR